MERTQSWTTITETGRIIQAEWKALAEEYGLSINVAGLPALSSFSFTGEHSLKYKTLITQEMLKKGYLASNSIYVCTEHTAEIVADYLQSLEAVFALIRDCEDGRDIDDLWRGRSATPGSIG